MRSPFAVVKMNDRTVRIVKTENGFVVYTDELVATRAWVYHSFEDAVNRAARALLDIKDFPIGSNFSLVQAKE